MKEYTVFVEQGVIISYPDCLCESEKASISIDSEYKGSVLSEYIITCTAEDGSESVTTVGIVYQSNSDVSNPSESSTSSEPAPAPSSFSPILLVFSIFVTASVIVLFVVRMRKKHK